MTNLLDIYYYLDTGEFSGPFSATDEIFQRPFKSPNGLIEIVSVFPAIMIGQRVGGSSGIDSPGSVPLAFLRQCETFTGTVV